MSTKSSVPKPSEWRTAQHKDFPDNKVHFYETKNPMLLGERIIIRAKSVNGDEWGSMSLSWFFNIYDEVK